MTFGEVVSSFNSCGNHAAKRHSHMSFAQQNHQPDNCTITEKVAVIRDKSQRPCLALRTPRSRTPSPSLSSRRPRSLPATPRQTSRGDHRRGGPHFGQLPDFGESFITGPVAGAHNHHGVGGHTDVPAHGSWRMPGGSERNFDGPSYSFGPGGSSAPGYAGNTCAGRLDATGWNERVPGHPSSCRGACYPGGACAANSSGACVHSSGSLGQHQSSRVGLYGSHGSASDLTTSRCGLGNISSRHVGVNEGISCSINPRVASFVRLNSFLLRTHVTSLVSALAEDGWVEGWEKERLCRRAREDSQSWALSFLGLYTRFMETGDVQNFVAGLKTAMA